MITKNEFEKLNLLLRMHMVNSKGELLGERSLKNYTVRLYNLEFFLVEVWYFNPENMVEKIEVVRGNKNLDLYV